MGRRREGERREGKGGDGDAGSASTYIFVLAGRLAGLLVGSGGESDDTGGGGGGKGHNGGVDWSEMD